MFLALSPGAVSLAWVASWNLFVIAWWHWTQSLEPTKVAPGTCGGMMIARFPVTHETSSSPQAAMPPKIVLFVQRARREVTAVREGSLSFRRKGPEGSVCIVVLSTARGCACVGKLRAGIVFGALRYHCAHYF